MNTDSMTWDADRKVWTVADTETHLVEIVPMLFNHRLVLTPKGCRSVYDVGWCYPSFETAVAAVLEWEPGTDWTPATIPDPGGYIKKIVFAPTDMSDHV